MISPLASPFRGGWRNLTPMRARGRGGQNPWTPIALAPYAWYDVHLGGTSSTIADTSGNGRADATYGATTAAPLYLPYTGTAYLHLEAATSGTNSLTCTAPANTASYAAYPLGGGAATTGAASAGAFTFTTDGDWTQVDLLDGSAVVLASFRASDSGQTGLTDAFSVAWTINRGTAGRKSVLVNRRSLALLGTNDRINVAAAALPTLDSDHSIVLVGRQWATPVNSGGLFFVRRTSGSTEGMYIANVATTESVRAVWRNSAPMEVSSSVAYTTGLRNVLSAVRSGASGTMYVNSTAGSAATLSGTYDSDADGSIGTTLFVFQDFEFEALVVLDRAITTTEIAQLVTYYGGGA